MPERASRQVLFSQSNLSFRILDRQRTEIVHQVGELQDVGASIEQVVSALSRRFRIEVPTLDQDDVVRKRIEHRVAQSSARDRGVLTRDSQRSISVEIHVPFSGDATFFDLRPDRWMIGDAPKGQVLGTNVVFESGRSTSDEHVDDAYARWLVAVEAMLAAHRTSYVEFNAGLERFIEIEFNRLSERSER